MLTGALYAQDRILKYGHQELVVKIKEIAAEQILYKLPGTDSTLHSIAKKEVAAVIWQDGTIEVMENPSAVNEYSAKKLRAPLSDSLKFGLNRKNTIGIDFLSLSLGALSVWYERSILKGYIGIQVPVYLRFRNHLSNFYGVQRNHAVLASSPFTLTDLRYPNTGGVAANASDAFLVFWSASRSCKC